MIPAVAIAVTAGISLGITVILVLLRGSFQLGKLVNQVNTQDTSIVKLNDKIDHIETKFDSKFDAVDARFDALEAKFDARFEALTAAIGQLQAEMQQTNQILVGLANHTHDADGRTVFTIPS